MPYASGSQLQVAYVPEVTPGTTPGSPIAKLLRVSSFGLSMERNVMESGELRSDRMYSDVRLGMRRVQGDIDCEFSAGSFDDFILAGLGGTFAPLRSSGSQSIAISAAGKTATRSAGSFLTDGFLVNDWVVLGGFANAGNNTLVQITAVTATVMTFGNSVGLVDEASAAGKTVTSFAGTMKAGTTMQSFSIEGVLNNINQYRLFNG